MRLNETESKGLEEKGKKLLTLRTKFQATFMKHPEMGTWASHW